MPETILRVIAAPAAIELIHQIRHEHENIIFYQSGGCCDGSSPMCYPQEEFIIGINDVKLGEIEGAPFYISAGQFEYWQHTQLIIDVVTGQGGMFSLENGTGKRFFTRSRLFTESEMFQLAAAMKR